MCAVVYRLACQSPNSGPTYIDAQGVTWTNVLDPSFAGNLSAPLPSYQSSSATVAGAAANGGSSLFSSQCSNALVFTLPGALCCIMCSCLAGGTNTALEACSQLQVAAGLIQTGRLLFVVRWQQSHALELAHVTCSLVMLHPAVQRKATRCAQRLAADCARILLGPG
jgi:hypothetical protein